MKYRVAQDASYNNFANEVNDALEDGWQLQGGVSVRSDLEGYPVYYQALVKETESPTSAGL
jgi:hypothetical protein